MLVILPSRNVVVRAFSYWEAFPLTATWVSVSFLSTVVSCHCECQQSCLRSIRTGPRLSWLSRPSAPLLPPSAPAVPHNPGVLSVADHLHHVVQVHVLRVVATIKDSTLVRKLTLYLSYIRCRDQHGMIWCTKGGSGPLYLDLDYYI